MFSNAKIDDKVWSLMHGWGTIINIEPGLRYPLIIQFANDVISYTRDGKLFMPDKNPTLFWEEIKFEIPKKPLPQLEVDTKVMVWMNKCEIREKRYFSHFDSDGFIHTFACGNTSWSNVQSTTTRWDNWELVKE